MNADVYIEPQGDGTVAFKNNADGAYITVQSGKMITPFNAAISNNEKYFLIYSGRNTDLIK